MKTPTCSRSRQPSVYLEDLGCGLAWVEMGTTRFQLPNTNYIMSTVTEKDMPDRSSPGLSRTAPPVVHQGGGEKYATGVTGTDFMFIGTWNVQSLYQKSGIPDRLPPLIKALDEINLRWSIIGLCEVKRKGQVKYVTKEGHVLYNSGHPTEENKEGVGCLVHKDIKETVLQYDMIKYCEYLSSRLSFIRLRAKPNNITIIQCYAPTSGYKYHVVEKFYSQIQDTIDNKVDRNDVLIIQGDWNARVGKVALETWKGICGPSCNPKTDDRGLLLLEFASYNDMLIANTFGNQKPAENWTWKHPGKKHNSQIDYILVPRWFRSGIQDALTQVKSKKKIGSDHNMVIMKVKFDVIPRDVIKTSGFSKMKFSLDQLESSDISEAFEAKVRDKLTPLLNSNGSAEILTEKFNECIIQTAKETLEEISTPEQLSVSDEDREMYNTRRDLGGNTSTATGAAAVPGGSEENRENNMKKYNKDWIEKQCNEIEEYLEKDDSRQAFHTVENLIGQVQVPVSIIHDAEGHCLTEDEDILKRWTEYYTEPYNDQAQGDPSETDSQGSSNDDDDDSEISREDVQEAIRLLEDGKVAGADDVPAELIKHVGETVVDILTKICKEIWRTGQWPKPWTQSLLIPFPSLQVREDNQHKCENYKTTSLISHASKIMLNVILKKLNTEAEKIVPKDVAWLRSGHSTTEQIFNLRVLCEKYREHKQDIFHVFIKLETAFDRAWHDELWAKMKDCNMSQKLIQTLQQLISKASSKVHVQGRDLSWFPTSFGLRNGCPLLSDTLFNFYLDKLMIEALKCYNSGVTIGEGATTRSIPYFGFAGHIAGLANSKDVLASFVTRLEETTTRYRLKISVEKTKLMSTKEIETAIQVRGVNLEKVKNFKYLGAIFSHEGSEPEIVARIEQTTAALAKLRPIWRDTDISLKCKLKLLHAVAQTTFLYACESWTLTQKLEEKLQAFEMRCLERLLGNITDGKVWEKWTKHKEHYEYLLCIMKKRKLEWSSSSSMPFTPGRV